MRWLITRPKADGDRVATLLARIGHDALICPLMEPVLIEATLPDLSDVQAVLATSRHGVNGFAKLTRWRDTRLFAVGEATAEAALNAGFDHVEHAGRDADALVDLARTRLRPSDGPLLRLRGEVARGDVAQSLANAGFAVRSLITYRIDQAEHLPDPARIALTEHSVDGALFFSPRSVTLFARLVDNETLGDCLAGLAALCLSPMVAESLDQCRWRTIRAAGTPSLAALVALAEEFENTRASPSQEPR